MGKNRDEDFKRVLLPVTALEVNKGQIEGVPKNPRFIRDTKYKALVKSIKQDPDFLNIRELAVYEQPTKGTKTKYVIIGGNMRYRAAKENGITQLPCKIIPNDYPKDKIRRFVLKDNSSFGETDWDLLLSEWDINEIEAAAIDIPNVNDSETKREQEKADAISTLAEDFIITPSSVLNTRGSEWTKRKQAWKALSLVDGSGREENLTFSNTAQPPVYYQAKNELRKKQEREPTHEEIIQYLEEEGKSILPSTSIFDPVLCEVLLTWFNIPKGKVLDPFAGGAVRGIISGVLGMPYIGNDLREEQIKENEKILKDFELPIPIKPLWTIGDSKRIDDIAKGSTLKPPYDIIFSCPPYSDLEKYSDLKEDISNMDYKEFLTSYRKIIKKSCSMLNNNRFAAFVVSEIRDKHGIYRGFVQDTIKAFQDAGLQYYNEIILVNQMASAAIRARGQMKNRKAVRTHQNIIVMHKPTKENEDISKIAEQEHQNIIIAYKGNKPNENIQKDFQQLKEPFDPLKDIIL